MKMIYIEDFVKKISDVLLPYIVPSVCIGIVLGMLSMIIIRDRDKWVGRCFKRVLFFTYAALIICETIVRRLDLHKETTDFLGFHQLLEDPWYIVSSVENVIMLIPFGFLLGIAFNSRMNFLKVVLITFLFSLCIEAVQFFLVIGEAEVLDMCTNLVGSLFGYGFMCIVRRPKSGGA